MDPEVAAKLKGKITGVRVEYSRSAEVTDGDWRKSGLAIEFAVTPDDNVRDVVLAAHAYCEAFVSKVLGPAAEAIKAQTMPEQAKSPASFPPAQVRDGPETVVQAPAEASPAPAEGEEGHTRIARFTLEAKPDDKYLLTLYPLIGDKAGKYPELKFTANKEGMWAMIGPEWDNDWKVPCDKEVDWLALWKLGREKTGPKAKPGSRYKDLCAIHGA